jgi:hypothetical protein
LTLAADVVGVVLIAFVLPLAWSTSIVVLAICLVAVNTLSRLYQRRADG